MKNSFKKVIKKAKEVSLTNDERGSMRLQLLDHLDTIPIAAEIGWREEIPSRVSIFSFIRSYAATSALMPALLLMVLIGGGTLTLASQGSLPGDAMYSMKQISEKIDLFFAFTPGAEARVNAIQAVRRLEEAEALSSQGKLDGVTKVALESSFSKASNAALKGIGELETENKTVGLRVLSEFKGNLSAHRDILQNMVASASGGISKALPEEVQSVISVLNAPTSSVIAVGVETKDSAQDSEAEAKRQISDVEKYISVNMTGEAKTKALGALIMAQASFENGRQAAEQDSYNNAVVLFKQAGEQAFQAKATAQSYNNVKRYITKLPSKPKVPAVAPAATTSSTITVSAIATSTASSTATTTATSTNATSTTTTVPASSSGSTNTNVHVNIAPNSGSSGGVGVQVNVGGSSGTSLQAGPAKL